MRCPPSSCFQKCNGLCASSDEVISDSFSTQAEETTKYTLGVPWPLPNKKSLELFGYLNQKLRICVITARKEGDATVVSWWSLLK